MTERTSGPDWEFQQGVSKLRQAGMLYLQALHDLETASRSGATAMAASVAVLLMNRVETLETTVRDLEARIAALEAERDAA